jgi:hypothetical protein
MAAGPERQTDLDLLRQIADGNEQGMAAEGTRVTTTIPIGAVGNDRPILVVAERWYSRELLINLRTERHDPRTGDVIFQLTNIRRTEPQRSIFQVPAGYTIKNPSR